MLNKVEVKASSEDECHHLSTHVSACVSTATLWPRPLFSLRSTSFVPPLPRKDSFPLFECHACPICSPGDLFRSFRSESRLHLGHVILYGDVINRAHFCQLRIGARVSVGMAARHYGTHSHRNGSALVGHHRCQ